MKDLNDYMDYGFETFDANGKSINLITGPGNSGTWLNDLFCSPQEVAIIPAPVGSVAAIAGVGRVWRTEMFPLDPAGNEIPGQRTEAALLECRESEARAAARHLGCDVYFWSSWEETRYIVIVSAANETDFPHSDDWTYYTANDF
jgi:hypothetical protein